MFFFWFGSANADKAIIKNEKEKRILTRLFYIKTLQNTRIFLRFNEKNSNNNTLYKDVSLSFCFGCEKRISFSQLIDSLATFPGTITH